MRVEVGEVKIVGYLGEDGARQLTTLFLKEEELFYLLSGHSVNARIAVGESIWVDVEIKKEEKG